MKLIEDPYYQAHLQSTCRRLMPINQYLLIALAIIAVLYAIGVISWVGLTTMLSLSVSIKLLAYFRILTAKRQLNKHRSAIGWGE